MFDYLLDEEEKVVLNCTPNEEILNKKYKMYKNLPKRCLIIFIFFMILYTVLLESLYAIIPLTLLFGPMAILLGFIIKSHIKSFEKVLHDKYIITNKRIFILNEENKKNEHILIHEIIEMNVINNSGINFRGYDEYKNIKTIRFCNLEDVNKVCCIIANQKGHFK